MTSGDEAEADVQEAVKVVLSFTSAMNDWETRRYYRSRADAGYYTASSDAKLAGGLTAGELDSEYHVIFERHCTKRKRTYGGFPGSWTQGGQYAGVVASTVLETNRVQPKRIEVVCRGGMLPDHQYRFVVFKKGDRWLIDNVFTRVGDETWQRWQL